jgi:hypothetical protein
MHFLKRKKTTLPMPTQEVIVSNYVELIPRGVFTEADLKKFWEMMSHHQFDHNARAPDLVAAEYVSYRLMQKIDHVPSKKACHSLEMLFLQLL